MKPFIYVLADLLNAVPVWIRDIYDQYGWKAALVVIVVLALLAAGVGYLFPAFMATLMGGK